MRRFVVLSLVLPSLSGALAPTVAFAATATTTTSPGSDRVQNFCTQVRASQTSIASLTGTTAAKNTRIGVEWTKIEKVAPANIKAQITLIKAAYVKASGQPDAAAKTTISAIASAGQKVTAFVTANCGNSGNGGGGAGGPGGGPQLDPARRAAIEACFKKEGVTFPAGGARPNFDDPKFQAAAQKCGFGGGPGGGGGRRGMSDAVRKCLADKGITLPTRPANASGEDTPPAAGAAGGGAGAGRGGRLQLDAKGQAALDACRAANP